MAFDMNRILSKVNIEQETLFKVGACSFFLIVCFNIGGLIDNWALYDVWGILKTLASTIFNLFLAGFFYTMLKNLKQMKAMMSSPAEEIDELTASFQE